jgi:multiple sugar transport system permease protein
MISAPQPPSSVPRAADPPHRKSRPRTARREALFGYSMIFLSFAVIVVFTLLPIVASVVLSFFNWDIINPARFVGLANYRALAHDPSIVRSFQVTILLAALIVAAQILLGLFLALLVQQHKAVWFRAVFRTAFFLPLLASAASVSIVFSYLFDSHFGVVNYYLHLVGIPQVPWLSSDAGATATIVIVAVWQQLGFVFILFTAALSSLPTDVLEAAAIDGSRSARTLWSIKLPLISPTMFFVAVVGFINAMQLFDQPYVLTQGGPGNATTTVVLLIYRTAFQNLQFGYGSAISVILFLVLLAATGLQFLVGRKWVFYT